MYLKYGKWSISASNFALWFLHAKGHLHRGYVPLNIATYSQRHGQQLPRQFARLHINPIHNKQVNCAGRVTSFCTRQKALGYGCDYDRAFTPPTNSMHNLALSKRPVQRLGKHPG